MSVQSKTAVKFWDLAKKMNRAKLLTPSQMRVARWQRNYYCDANLGEEHWKLADRYMTYLELKKLKNELIYKRKYRASNAA